MKRIAVVFLVVILAIAVSAQGDEFPPEQELPDLNTISITSDNIDQLMDHPDFGNAVAGLDATRLTPDVLVESELTSKLSLEQIQSIDASADKISALVFSGDCNCINKLTAEQLATIIDDGRIDFEPKDLSDDQLKDLINHLHAQGDLSKLGPLKRFSENELDAILDQLAEVYGISFGKNFELNGCKMSTNSKMDCWGASIDLKSMAGLEINVHFEKDKTGGYTAGWLFKGENHAGDYFDVRFYNAKTIERNENTGNLIINGAEHHLITPKGKGHATIWITDEGQYQIFKGLVTIDGITFDQRPHHSKYSKDGLYKDTNLDGKWDQMKTQHGFLDCANNEGAVENCGADYENKPRPPKEPAIYDPDEPIEEPTDEYDENVFDEENAEPGEPVVDDSESPEEEVEEETQPGLDCEALDNCGQPGQIDPVDSESGVVNTDGGQTTYSDEESETSFSIGGDAIISGGLNDKGQFVGSIGTLDEGAMPHVRASGGLHITADGEMLVESDIGPGVQVQLVSGSELIGEELPDGSWSWSCRQCVMEVKATSVVLSSDSEDDMSTMVVTPSSHLAHAALAQDATITHAGTFGVQNDGTERLPLVIVQNLDDEMRRYYEQNHEPRHIIMEESLLEFGAGFMLSFGDDHTILEGDLSLIIEEEESFTPTGLAIGDITTYIPNIPEFRRMYATHDSNNYAQLAMNNNHRVAFVLHNDNPQSSVISVFHSGHHVLVETDSARLMRTSVDQLNADLLDSYDTTFRGHPIEKDPSILRQATLISFSPENQAQIDFESNLFFENTLWGIQ